MNFWKKRQKSQKSWKIIVETCVFFATRQIRTFFWPNFLIIFFKNFVFFEKFVNKKKSYFYLKKIFLIQKIKKWKLSFFLFETFEKNGKRKCRIWLGKLKAKFNCFWNLNFLKWHFSKIIIKNAKLILMEKVVNYSWKKNFTCQKEKRRKNDQKKLWRVYPPKKIFQIKISKFFFFWIEFDFSNFFEILFFRIGWTLTGCPRIFFKKCLKLHLFQNIVNFCTRKICFFFFLSNFDKCFRGFPNRLVFFFCQQSSSTIFDWSNFFNAIFFKIQISKAFLSN